MRGRGGQPSSSVFQEQPRMALRKELVSDGTGIGSEIHHAEENSQDDDAVDDKGDKDELSLSLLPPTTARDKRRRERESKSKCKEMTEEEMMDLALRLSEQEANVSASRLKQEEEAVMKAIQESMFSQTEPCPPSQSQSLLPDAEASLRLCSRRKLLYSNRKRKSAITQGALEEDVPPEANSNQEVKTTGDENNNPNKTHKRKEGSPLPEMPDLSQTQRIYSQASPCSSESFSGILDSPQSSDSTQIEDCQLRKSPVFPLTGCRATVCVPRLSQEVLKTCTTSGFVSCSQDSSISTQKFLLLKPKSPTFARSSSNITACPKSPVFSENDQGEDEETELSPERGKSPVFGRNTQSETFPSACKPQVCKTSGLMFSSQESLASTVRSTTCRPKSPVFPGSPSLPNNLPALERSAICKSPVFLETEQGRPEQTHCCSTSPVFGRTGQQQEIHSDPKNSTVVPSTVQLKGSNNEVDSLAFIESSQSQREDRKADRSEDRKFNKISTSKTRGAPESDKLPKDCNSTDSELTSDMTLLWSDDDDDDITPAGSPSPVFPEERPGHQADSGSPSPTHTTATSPATTGSNCSNQGLVNRTLTSSEEPAAGPMVHYYWGVPFCPRGLNPDSYTQVILAQMEVYEKSLKQAQRCLLRKAEWGEPIVPQPEKSPSPESPAESPQPQIPQRYGFRLRGKKLSESADASPAEEEEEEDKKKGKEVLETENKEKEKKQEGADKDDTDDCEVCPETQLSNEDNNSLLDPTMAPDHKSELKTEAAEIEMIQDDSPSADLQVEEEMEVDAPVDGQSEENASVRRNDGGQNRKEIIKEQRLDTDVEDLTERELPRSASPELELAAVPRGPEVHIDCPICQGSFPVTEIEVHAAYCDGEVAVVEERRPEVNSLQSPLKSRRKRTRRADVTHEETNSHSTTARNHEKCYICNEAVPLRDYSHHTELCIQHRTSKTQAKGNLLSALEQTESRDSDAGPSKLQAGDVIDLRDDDDDDDDDGGEGSGGVSAFGVSNSPIRSFTSISEATDCLIDFKTQLRTKKPSKRRR